MKSAIKVAEVGSVDYSLLAQELMKSLRDSKSQAWLNQKLNYSYNQVSRWENGTKKVRWKDFVDVCHVLNLNLRYALIAIGYPIQKEIPTSSELVNHLIGTSVSKNISQASGLSKDKISRWRLGKVDIDLTDLLLLIDNIRSHLYDFVSALTDVETIPLLKGRFAIVQKQREVYQRYPFIAILLRLFEIKKITNSSEDLEFLATCVGAQPDDLKAALSAGIDCGFFTLDDDGHFVTEIKHMRLGNKREYQTKIKSYWLEKAMEQLQDSDLELPPKKEVFGYSVFSINEDKWDKVLDAYLNFYNEIRTIVVSDQEPPTSVKVLNVQVFDVDIERKQ